MEKKFRSIQKPEESPSQLYETLSEIFQLYTLFNPKAAKNQHMINAAFVSQPQGDIR